MGFMQTRVHASRTPTILYVDYLHKDGINRRRLDGLRRYAATHKWRVATLEHGVCSPSALREAFARLRPIGCAVECWSPETTLPPFLFGRVPAVYFSRQEGRGWQGACSVEVDDAAVARKAFAELSLSNPCAYAIVTTNNIRKRWTRERIDNFRECCRKAGFDCPVFHFPGETEKQRDVRPGLMKAWAAALPHRCAVFATNDFCAHRAAKAFADAGRPFPRTVTLVGADGSEPQPDDREFAELVSSVRLDFELAGYLAAKMLASPPPAGTIMTFPPLLVDRRKSTRGSGRRESWVIEAVDLIRRKACDGLESADLPARFHVSRRLFDLRFREAMGHTAQDEIEHVRMERVFTLLRDTSVPIGSIAAFCGWHSDIALRWLFRRRMGMSMRDWRQNLK